MSRFEFNVSTGESKTVEYTDAEKTAMAADAVEDSKRLYIHQRRKAYPDIGDQLDDLYKKGAFSDEMAAKIKKVKDDNPKP